MTDQYLLDTNVVSELRKPVGRINPQVADWAAHLPHSICAVSVITIFELEQGVQLKELSDPIQGRHLRSWLDNQVRSKFTVIPLNEVSARLAAALHCPNLAPLADSFLAATAITANLILATHNIADFEPFTAHGLRLHNPWQ